MQCVCIDEVSCVVRVLNVQLFYLGEHSFLASVAPSGGRTSAVITVVLNIDDTYNTLSSTDEERQDRSDNNRYETNLGVDGKDWPQRRLE